MKTISRKYQIGSLTLALIFCAFNVGFPIVIAACPMMLSSSPRGSCCISVTERDGYRIQQEVNTSCCKIVIVAGRNTNEFLQAKEYSPIFLNNIAPIISFNIVPVFASSSYLLLSSFPASPGKDIPIFTSSLLI